MQDKRRQISLTLNFHSQKPVQNSLKEILFMNDPHMIIRRFMNRC